MNWKIVIIAGSILLTGTLYADKPHDKTLPIHGEFSGIFLGFNPPPAGRCQLLDDKVTWAVTSFAGWGKVSHMGWTYVYAEHCSYTDTTYGQGYLEIVAANGDTLYGTYEDGFSYEITPSIVGFQDNVTFHDGGTGRFTYASGGGVEMGSVDFSDGSFTLLMNGVISYSKK